MNEEKEERILMHERRKGPKTPTRRKHATRPYDRRQRQSWRRGEEEEGRTRS